MTVRIGIDDKWLWSLKSKCFMDIIRSSIVDILVNCPIFGMLLREKPLIQDLNSLGQLQELLAEFFECMNGWFRGIWLRWPRSKLDILRYWFNSWHKGTVPNNSPLFSKCRPGYAGCLHFLPENIALWHPWCCHWQQLEHQRPRLVYSALA